MATMKAKKPSRKLLAVLSALIIGALSLVSANGLHNANAIVQAKLEGTYSAGKVTLKGADFPSEQTVSITSTFGTTTETATTKTDDAGLFSYSVDVPAGYYGPATFVARAKVKGVGEVSATPKPKTDTEAPKTNTPKTNTPGSNTPSAVVPGVNTDPKLTGTVKILPLGDSITAGGYPIKMYEFLKSSGIDVDNVGSLKYDSDVPDKDHEGHSGWRTDEIANSVTEWINTYQPDVVTLHIGTNDMLQQKSVTDAAGNLEKILLNIETAKPGTRVIVSSIIPINQDAQKARVAEYNSQIKSIVQAKKAAGQSVSMVDAHGAFAPGDISSDGVHTSGSGVERLGQVFADGVKLVVD